MVSMITVAYHTLGCKVNQYETEKIRESLEQAGFATVPFGSRADAYVINTCTVTAVADSKSRAAVRKAMRANPDAFVVVAGCYAELEPGRIAEIEGVDLVVANDDKNVIPERVIAHFAAFSPHPNPLPPGERESRGGHSTFNIQHSTALNPQPSTLNVRPRLRTRAVVKVQDGCDHFCSYCVVPYARSRRFSRPLEEVLAELRSLAEFGYKEIVLTGIRLGSYRCGSTRLPELIREAARIDGIERIRLSSVEPWEIDDALLDAMDSPKVCRHLHIPLQSGDDGVLREMNRPYDSGQYTRIIDRVRRRIDGIGITTDVMAGFPGETEEAFENTCALIEKIGFSRTHVFRYSVRKRTKAASLPNQVDVQVKKRRAEKLIELGRIAMRRFASSLVGQTLEVLVQSEINAGADRESGKRSPGLQRPDYREHRGGGNPSKILSGLTDNYVVVSFPGDSSLKGEIVPVRIAGIGQDGGAVAECRVRSAELGVRADGKGGNRVGGLHILQDREQADGKARL